MRAKMNNFEFFSLNLNKLPNYLQCFGFYSVECIVESWVKAEMGWMEVDATGWRLMELGGDRCTVRNTHSKSTPMNYYFC